MSLTWTEPLRLRAPKAMSAQHTEPMQQSAPWNMSDGLFRHKPQRWTHDHGTPRCWLCLFHWDEWWADENWEAAMYLIGITKAAGFSRLTISEP